MANSDIQLNKIPMDLATVLLLIVGFGLLSTAIAFGGTPESFFNVPTILIAFGGTLSVTTLYCSLSEMARTVGVILKTYVHNTRDPLEAATHVLKIADLTRKKGMLALQNERGEGEPFLYKGITMVVDETPGEEVETIVRPDSYATQSRNIKCSSMLRKAANFALAMGLIGTPIGLVQMLSKLDDPSTIGQSVAVALFTTFYGVALANMVFMPLAAKLERTSAEESMVNNVCLIAAASIGKQENPRRLEMMLNSVLPPTKRVSYFD